MSVSYTERIEAEEARQADDHLDAAHGIPVCPVCLKPVEPGRDWRKVVGYVNPSGKDGFRRDHYEDEWVHRVCLDIEKSVGRDQMGLGL